MDRDSFLFPPWSAFRDARILIALPLETESLSTSGGSICWTRAMAHMVLDLFLFRSVSTYPKFLDACFVFPSAVKSGSFSQFVVDSRVFRPRYSGRKCRPSPKRFFLLCFFFETRLSRRPLYVFSFLPRRMPFSCSRVRTFPLTLPVLP